MLLLLGLNLTSLDRSEDPSLSGWDLHILTLTAAKREVIAWSLFIQWNDCPSLLSDQKHKYIILFCFKSHFYILQTFLHFADLASRLIKSWSRNNNDFLRRKMCMLEMLVECFTSINLSSKPAEKWECLLITQIQTKMLFLWAKTFPNFVCEGKVLCGLLHILPSL